MFSYLNQVFLAYIIVAIAMIGLVNIFVIIVDSEVIGRCILHSYYYNVLYVFYVLMFFIKQRYNLIEKNRILKLVI